MHNLIGRSYLNVSDDEIEAAKYALWVETEGLEVGLTEMVTAARLSKPTIPRWMTIPKGPERAQAKEELKAYKQIIADKEEAVIRQSKEMLAMASPTSTQLPTMGDDIGSSLGGSLNLKAYF